MQHSGHVSDTLARGDGDAKRPDETTSARTALILYGSETGNAQDVAEEVARMVGRLHFETVVLDLDSVQLRDVLKHTVVIFALSTTGQGEMPQNARLFWKSLLSGALKPGAFRRLRFSSFGLGDSSYPRYNVAHRMLYGRLLQLGAKCVCERGEGNEQHPEGHSAGFREWIIQLREGLQNKYPLGEGLLAIPDDKFVEPNWKLVLQAGQADIPAVIDDDHGTVPSSALLPVRGSFISEIVSNERVTTSEHFQNVRLLDISLHSQYIYGPGAVAVIYPKNFPEDVSQFINLMDWHQIADQPLTVTSKLLQDVRKVTTPSPVRHLDLSTACVTLRWLIENVLDIMSIPRRSFFATLLDFAGDSNEDESYQKERLRELANPELIDELWDYTTRPKRTILEVMMDFTTIKIPWQYVLSTIPILRGRQFSIASGGTLTSQSDSKTRVQLLVAIADPPSPIIKWRRRYGVCTRYITSLEAGQRINIGMQQGYLDVKPTEIDRPVIMIGPGTGVAPMRALIYQRLEWAKEFSSRRSAGQRLEGDILFFGCRNQSADYFFRNEWSNLSRNEGLAVFTAFSRDAEKPKKHVQDLIRAEAELVSRTLLKLNGNIYVCGSSGNMPKGVREALVDVLVEQSKTTSREEAEAFLLGMEKSGKYKQETW